LLQLLERILALLQRVPWAKILTTVLTIVDIVTALGPSIQAWIDNLTGHVDERLDDVGTALTDVEDGIRGIPGPDRTDLPAIREVVTSVLVSIQPDGELYQALLDNLNYIIQQQYLLRLSLPVAQTAQSNTIYGSPVVVTESGWVTLGDADGVQVEVNSVPASQGIEYAGAFARYPHLGWLVPGSDEGIRAGDLAYLGPAIQGITFTGLRSATGVWVFLRPGAQITITPWVIGISD